ncbi:MAG: hypothetical protein ACKVUT_00960 [Gaiella sp.]
MTRWKLLTLLALLTAALALVGAGCGGGGSDETTAIEETAGSGITESTPEEPEPTETVDTEPPTETSGSGTVDCAEMRSAEQEYAKAIAGASGTDPASIITAYETFEGIVDRMPEEIRGDFQILADGFRAYADLLKSVDFASGETPDAETVAKIQELFTGEQATKAQQALERITAWQLANCAP